MLFRSHGERARLPNQIGRYRPVPATATAVLLPAITNLALAYLREHHWRRDAPSLSKRWKLDPNQADVTF